MGVRREEEYVCRIRCEKREGQRVRRINRNLHLAGDLGVGVISRQTLRPGIRKSPRIQFV